MLSLAAKLIRNTDACSDNSTVSKLGPRSGPAWDEKPLGLIRVGISVVIRGALSAIEFAD